ncbi:hypothetical protein H6G33_19955 [Calothrix sp. FACHB-1219]|uniref:hypothetical protein n=1 Tax=unclassified Calothrix TaxID=2619626 RepID=UPI00168666E7|nr:MULTISPECIES: hypothetical protein [unclassified Calothrix]MBD2204500.1 hypothetical protein [Calothrix sp. FACHB-168]MBD2219298.1 hypothetical protein [Calothrix sp. FACHB-1219]
MLIAIKVVLIRVNVVLIAIKVVLIRVNVVLIAFKVVLIRVNVVLIAFKVVLIRVNVVLIAFNVVLIGFNIVAREFISWQNNTNLAKYHKWVGALALPCPLEYIDALTFELLSQGSQR